MLANTLYAATYGTLRKNYQMVDQAGPDVLVVHAALTDGRRSQKVPNLASQGYLPVKVASYEKRLLAGVDLGVGKVVIEAEFTDGQTGQRVAATVDGRPGAKSVSGGPGGRWKEVTLAYDWWAQLWDKRLSLMKKGDFGTTNLQ